MDQEAKEDDPIRTCLAGLLVRGFSVFNLKITFLKKRLAWLL